MNELYQKIAYLRGVCDGSGFTKDSKEGKVFHGILDVLDDMSSALQDYMDDQFFGDVEDTGDDAYYDYAVICPSCGEEVQVDDDSVEEGEDIMCPKCGNAIPMGILDEEDLKF